MHIKATHKVENSIISTTLTVDALGSSTLTADEEREILGDYGIELNYGSILFTRYVTINNHKDPEIVEITPPSEEDQPTTDPNEPTEPAQTIEADLITLAMPDETYTINEDMELKYAVDIRTLENRLSNYNYFEHAADLGKAMILVYESCVASFIKEKLEFAKQHHDSFEGEVFYDV